VIVELIKSIAEFAEIPDIVKADDVDVVPIDKFPPIVRLLPKQAVELPIIGPVNVNDPVASILPVNTWLFVKEQPNVLLPQEYTIDEVTC
jgi:hypothetical protein